MNDIDRSEEPMGKYLFVPVHFTSASMIANQLELAAKKLRKWGAPKKGSRFGYIRYSIHPNDEPFLTFEDKP